MSFNDDEKSAAASQPRELIEISHGNTTYYIATGDRDVTYNGYAYNPATGERIARQNLYVATPSTRSEVVSNDATKEIQLEVSIPADHALARRYVALGGVPPRQVLVRLLRVQLRSGEFEQLWTGYVTSMAFDGHIAKLAVPQRTPRSLQRSLPTVLVDTACQHILYDAGCKADRASNSYAAHVTYVDGASVSIAFDVTYPAGDQWARAGELVHVASGERMTIGDQTGLSLSLQAPIAELAIGASVLVVAGCAHDIVTCKTKFSNVVNFGGLPQRPTTNPSMPTGFGVYTES